MLTDDNVEELKQRVNKFRPGGINERRTREWLIDFALRFLGWHVSEYRRVNTEHSITGPGGAKESRVDYVLFAENGNPAVFVEAKKLDGMGEASVAQLRRYAFEEIARKGTQNLASLVLTDGNVWKFYPLSHGRGIEYHPHWCHMLNLGAEEAYQIKEDLNNLLDIQKVSSGESSKYLERLFRLNRTKEACKEILEKHQIKRDVRLVFGEQMEKIAELANLVIDKGEIQDCAPEQKEVEEAVLKYIIPPPVSVGIPDEERNHGKHPQQDDGDKTKRGKIKELEVKWGDKKFKGKNKTRVMGNVIAEFANVFGIDTVAKKCTELDHEIPTVMAVTEVDKYKETRGSIRHKKVSGAPNYVYLAGLSGEDNANRLNLLARALGITQFVVKLDGKLHR